MNVKLLFWFTLILSVFGLVMISSAGVYLSQKNFGTDYYYFSHQLLYGFLPGLALFLIASRIDYRKWKKISFLLILLSLGFLVLIFMPGFGISVGGAKRWVNFLGLFSFQPAEILKLSLIIYLASWLQQINKNSAGPVIAFLIILFLIGVFIAAQPDIGTLGIIISIALLMFFAVGGKFRQILWIIILIAVSFTLLTVFSEYRFNRFLVLINKDIDVQGIGYHLNQSLISIGKGGLLGVGFGKGEQKLGFLPEPVGDSIFAVIGEELGFVGMVFLLGLFLFIIFLSLKIAKKSSDRFASLYAIGFASWIGIQSFINIASLSGIIPLTGVPLPFISYGGTSMAVLMTGAGILANIAQKAKV
jgi:cell division protein FtsW